MTPKEERDRMFDVVWRVALSAAAPPIKTGLTTIGAEVADLARALLTDMGYDWEAGAKEYRQKVRHYKS